MHCTALLHNRRCLRFVWIGFGDRTGRAQPRSGTARLCEEQPSQKMKPQARQWCLTTYVHHPLRHRAEFATVAAVTRSVTVEVPTELTYAFSLHEVCRTVGPAHGYSSLSIDSSDALRTAALLARPTYLVAECTLAALAAAHAVVGLPVPARTFPIALHTLGRQHARAQKGSDSVCPFHSFRSCAARRPRRAAVPELRKFSIAFRLAVPCHHERAESR